MRDLKEDLVDLYQNDPEKFSWLLLQVFMEVCDEEKEALVIDQIWNKWILDTISYGNGRYPHLEKCLYEIFRDLYDVFGVKITV